MTTAAGPSHTLTTLTSVPHHEQHYTGYYIVSVVGYVVDYDESSFECKSFIDHCLLRACARSKVAKALLIPPQR